MHYISLIDFFLYYIFRKTVSPANKHSSKMLLYIVNKSVFFSFHYSTQQIHRSKILDMFLKIKYIEFKGENNFVFVFCFFSGCPQGFICVTFLKLHLTLSKQLTHTCCCGSFILLHSSSLSTILHVQTTNPSQNMFNYINIY